MKTRGKNRLIALCLILTIAIVAVGLLLFAIRKDLNHYYSLSQITNHEAPREQNGIRVGGMVSTGSFKRDGDSLKVTFSLTDFKNPALPVTYTGILPDLFREGQGVIARGKLGNDGIFYATQILAKHDENYMPAELKADLKKSGYQHNKGN